MIKWLEHPEYVSFLMEIIPGHTEPEIREAFQSKFGIVLTEGQIGNFKYKHSIKSGTNGGCFKKGQIPHNLGKKVNAELYKKMQPTMFRKGNIPPNHRPVGSERVTVDGYVEVKIAEPNQWKLKHRLVYEKIYHVKLDKKDIIILLDGNKQNFEQDNLYRLSRRELVRYNQDHLYTNDKYISLAAAQISVIKDSILRRKK